ncbi:MAG: hypothetical protein ABI947_26685 [Chloroflexota bacterium]
MSSDPWLVSRVTGMIGTEAVSLPDANLLARALKAAAKLTA